ncbi:hypothetical protein H920_00398 [Fukomys damarensis]|uniref:Uncharacterized protein n=1 Tax=Fukomys damarensis TaxID=885580 RepID=A0A091E4G6_FUKDA|nr:hypothetical protein H920_00398 [Fukomys damarensis]
MMTPADYGMAPFRGVTEGTEVKAATFLGKDFKEGLHVNSYSENVWILLIASLSLLMKQPAEETEVLTDVLQALSHDAPKASSPQVRAGLGQERFRPKEAGEIFSKFSVKPSHPSRGDVVLLSWMSAGPAEIWYHVTLALSQSQIHEKQSFELIQDIDARELPGRLQKVARTDEFQILNNKVEKSMITYYLRQESEKDYTSFKSDSSANLITMGTNFRQNT